MKKLVFFLFVCFFMCNVKTFCQELSFPETTNYVSPNPLLDEHNGINPFNFGDDIRKHSHRLVKIDITNNPSYKGDDFYNPDATINYYRVINNGANSYFSVKYDELILSFTNNELCTILLVWKYNYDNFHKLLSDFTKIYGQGSKFENPLYQQYYWGGDKVKAHLYEKKDFKTDLSTYFILKMTHFDFEKNKKGLNLRNH